MCSQLCTDIICMHTLYTWTQHVHNIVHMITMHFTYSLSINVTRSGKVGLITERAKFSV